MAFERKVIANLGQPLTTGSVTLVAGAALELNAMVGHTVNARVLISRKVLGAGALGNLSYSIAGLNLSIASSAATEVSTVDYAIIG